jgi:hypothetical protein
MEESREELQKCLQVSRNAAVMGAARETAISSCISTALIASRSRCGKGPDNAEIEIVEGHPKK